MDRRGFLRLLGMGAVGAAVASTVDVDRLLWEPGKTTFFDLWRPVPFETVAIDIEEQFGVDIEWTKHGFVTPDWVVKESLRHLKNNTSFSGMANRNYDVGETVNLRLPQGYIVCG